MKTRLACTGEPTERIDTSSIQVTVISSIRTFVDIDAPNAERSESVSTLTVVSTRRIHAARLRRAPVLTRRTLVNVIKYGPTQPSAQIP